MPKFMRDERVYFYQCKSEPSNSMIAFYCRGINEIRTRNAARRTELNLRSRNSSSSRGGSGGSTRRGHHTCRDRNKNVMYILILGIALPISFARLRTAMNIILYILLRFRASHPISAPALCISALRITLSSLVGSVFRFVARPRTQARACDRTGARLGTSKWRALLVRRV